MPRSGSKRKKTARDRALDVLLRIAGDEAEPRDVRLEAAELAAALKPAPKEAAIGFGSF